MASCLIFLTTRTVARGFNPVSVSLGTRKYIMTHSSPLYIGIDVSKATLDMDAYPQINPALAAQYCNDDIGRKQLSALLGSLQP